MPNLELLTLEFETGQVRRVELEVLVSKALTWQFPLQDERFHLAPHASPPKRVKRFSWRDMPDHVGLICGGCDRSINDTRAFRGQAIANAGFCACSHAPERIALKARGFGPRNSTVWAGCEGWHVSRITLKEGPMRVAAGLTAVCVRGSVAF